MRIRIGLAVLMSLVLAAIAVTASGASGATTQSEPKQAQITTITVGGIPGGLSIASWWYAVFSRTFSKAHVGVKFVPTVSGQTAIPLLLNGQLDINLGDAVSALNASSQGLPVRVLGLGQLIGKNDKTDTNAVLSKPGSGITTIGDLEGKKVAVNALGGIAQIGVTEGLLKAGRDPSKIQWVQLPVPSTIAAIQNGTVDAGIINEPFVTQGKDAGLSAFGALYKGVGGLPQAVFVTSQAWIDKNKAVAKVFYEAMIAANAYAATHPKLLRAALKRYTTVDPSVIARENLPLTTPPAVSKAGMASLQSILLKYGVMKQAANLNTLLYTPPKPK